jgi:hypothetical protein
LVFFFFFFFLTKQKVSNYQNARAIHQNVGHFNRVSRLAMKHTLASTNKCQVLKQGQKPEISTLLMTRSSQHTEE